MTSPAVACAQVVHGAHWQSSRVGLVDVVPELEPSLILARRISLSVIFAALARGLTAARRIMDIVHVVLLSVSCPVSPLPTIPKVGCNANGNTPGLSGN